MRSDLGRGPNRPTHQGLELLASRPVLVGRAGDVPPDACRHLLGPATQGPSGRGERHLDRRRVDLRPNASTSPDRLGPLEQRRECAASRCRRSPSTHGERLLLPQDQHDQVLRIRQPEFRQNRPVQVADATVQPVDQEAELVVQRHPSPARGGAHAATDPGTSGCRGAEQTVREPYRVTVVPSGATRNLVKFHFTDEPSMPPVRSFRNAKTGSVSEPLTLISTAGSCTP